MDDWPADEEEEGVVDNRDSLSGLKLCDAADMDLAVYDDAGEEAGVFCTVDGAVDEFMVEALALVALLPLLAEAFDAGLIVTGVTPKVARYDVNSSKKCPKSS